MSSILSVNYKNKDLIKRMKKEGFVILYGIRMKNFEYYRKNVVKLLKLLYYDKANVSIITKTIIM